MIIEKPSSPQSDLPQPNLPKSKRLKLIEIGIAPHNGIFSIGVSPHGLISIGAIPHGLISIGLVPMGLISIGLVSMGLCSAGLITMGLVSFGKVNMSLKPIHPMATQHPETEMSPHQHMSH